jgi:hypothetical protein
MKHLSKKAKYHYVAQAWSFLRSIRGPSSVAKWSTKLMLICFSHTKPGKLIISRLFVKRFFNKTISCPETFGSV